MPEAATEAGNRTRLLIIDDDPPLLRLMQTYLGRMGFDVLAAGDLTTALEVLRRESGVEIAVADLSVMATDGELEQLADIRPDLRVLVCSGRPFEVEGLRPDLHSRFGFLQKPFVPKMLAEAVHELLRRDATRHRGGSRESRRSSDH